MPRNPDVLRNIIDFGGIKRGDYVEYVSVLYDTGGMMHGRSMVMYACNAYIELSNGLIIDGLVDDYTRQNVIISGKRVIPGFISERVLKRVIDKLQVGGHKLAEPYQRVMRILAEAAGCALDDKNGRFSIVKAHTPKQSIKRKAKITYEETNPELPTKEDAYRKHRAVKSWREQKKETWDSRCVEL